MQKRLFGIVASIAVIAAACGGASTSSAPASQPAASQPAASTGTSSTAPSSAPSGGALAADQVLHVSLGAEDPDTLDPSKASTSTDIGVLHALNRGLIYFDKDLNPVPSLADGAADHLGRRPDLHVHPPRRREVQQRRPDRRR